MNGKLPKPTPAETEILNVLWDQGPCMVKQVQARLAEQRAGEPRPSGYTTILKLMQIMAEKGLLRRVEGEGRAHVYIPVIQRDTAQRQMVRELVDRLFGGSPAQMVLQALEERPATAEELDEIRRLIEARSEGGAE
ncbi:MAG: BlaI/MecI/CopY family transcriptional regulator [Bryobacteraceae bacterium]